MWKRLVPRIPKIPAGPASSRLRGRRVGGLLRQRDFRLLCIGETTSQMGGMVTFVAMPLIAVTVLHVSTFLVGALSAMAWLPALLVSLPAGAWVDRLPRRPVMLVCDAVSLITFASVPVASSAGQLAIIQLLAVALIGGTSQVVFTTAYNVYLPSLLATHELAEGNAKLQGSARAAEIGGRSLGGLLAQLFGPVSALLVDSATFLVSAACLLAIQAREPREPSLGPARSLRGEIGEGLWSVAGDPYLRALVLFIAVAYMAVIGFFTLEVVFLVRDIHVAPVAIGCLVAASGAGGLLGASIATRITGRFGTARGLLLTAAISFPFGLLVPLAQPGVGLILLVGGYLGIGAGIAICSITIFSFWQTYCPRRILGRVSATLRFLVQGAIFIGALLAGVLGNSIGNRATLWIIAVTLILAGIPLVASPLRQHRELPTAVAVSRES